MGSTSLSSEGLGRHLRRSDLLEPCDLGRRGTSLRDTRSTLVMKGSPVRVRASASRYYQGASRRPRRAGEVRMSSQCPPAHGEVAASLALDERQTGRMRRDLREELEQRS